MRAARGATIGVAANGRWAMPNDLEILEQLNHDYVASVQHSDVGRFEEILAADFYCSNPDGSLVDRREFLQQAAHPVTISGLDARDVKIRLFGDVSRSFTRGRPIRPPTARPRPGATPMSGHASTETGSPYPLMSLADKTGRVGLCHRGQERTSRQHSRHPGPEQWQEQCVNE